MSLYLRKFFDKIEEEIRVKGNKKPIRVELPNWFPPNGLKRCLRFLYHCSIQKVENESFNYLQLLEILEVAEYLQIE